MFLLRGDRNIIPFERRFFLSRWRRRGGGATEGELLGKKRGQERAKEEEGIKMGRKKEEEGQKEGERTHNKGERERAG